jgi:hypothetical protein
MKHLLTLVFVVLAVLAVLAVALCLYTLAVDWAMLDISYAAFAKAAVEHTDLRILFITDADQNMHRLNCFMEGVGVALGSLLFAVSLIGLVLVRRS